MKKSTIRAQLLRPIIILMLFIPILSGIIFYIFARDHAHRQAQMELQQMDKVVWSLFDKDYSHEEFLKQISRISVGNTGNARVLVLSGENHVIYPRDLSEDAEIQQLVGDFLGVEDHSGMEEITASNGKKYLFSLHLPARESKRFGGIIVYCPSEMVGSWVTWATAAVLVISWLSAAVIYGLLCVSSKKITEPLIQLGIEAKRIGSGDFTKTQTAFEVTELEELRLSMDQMAEQLAQADYKQKLFFQNTSHELRTPLTSITGYAQGIELGVFSDVKSAAHTIFEESMRLTKIVDGILTISRMDMQNMPVSMTEVNVREVIEDSIRKIHGTAVQKKIDLVIEAAEPEMTVLGDRELLEKVLEQVLDNGLRYARKLIRITVTRMNDMAAIQITDDGHGIRPKDQSHIFEPCYKGEDGNYGIGLAVAASAVRQMHGQISAGNTEQGGACFTIMLLAK